MIDKHISITIRPTYVEFITLKNPMDTFIEWLEPEKYIVALEKGKDNKFNHYQIGLLTHKHIDSVRRKVDNLFKPFLSDRTLKLNIWRKVKIHNDNCSLIGYCAKENNIYKTSLSPEIIKNESIRYMSRTREAKKIQVQYCYRRFCVCGTYGCKHSFQKSYELRKLRKEKTVEAGIGAEKGTTGVGASAGT